MLAMAFILQNSVLNPIHPCPLKTWCRVFRYNLPLTSWPPPNTQSPTEVMRPSTIFAPENHKWLLFDLKSELLLQQQAIRDDGDRLDGHPPRPQIFSTKDASYVMLNKVLNSKSHFSFTLTNGACSFDFVLEFEQRINSNDSKLLDAQLEQPIEVSLNEEKTRIQDFIFVLCNEHSTLEMAHPRLGVFRIGKLHKGSYVIRIFLNEEWLLSIPFVLSDDRNVF